MLPSMISPEWLEAVSVVAATGLAGYAVVKQLGDDKARRQSVDAKIGAEALWVRRTIRGWIIPIQHQQAGMVPNIDAVVIARKELSGAVEERLHRMVAEAPHASPHVAKAVGEAYVLYFKAKGPTLRPPEKLDDLQARQPQPVQVPNEVVMGDLRACVERLTATIQPELRDY